MEQLTPPPPELETLRFSHNWNGKVGCDYFTTLRLHNPKKYATGKRFQVYLGKAAVGIYEVVDVKGALYVIGGFTRKLNNLTNNNNGKKKSN